MTKHPSKVGGRTRVGPPSGRDNAVPASPGTDRAANRRSAPNSMGGTFAGHEQTPPLVPPSITTKGQPANPAWDPRGLAQKEPTPMTRPVRDCFTATIGGPLAERLHVRRAA